MPSHKTHLSIAIEVNKYLNFDNDLIMLGSVLPDLTINHTHRLSHCRNNENGIKGLANPQIFLDKYKYKVDNNLDEEVLKSQLFEIIKKCEKTKENIMI